MVRPVSYSDPYLLLQLLSQPEESLEASNSSELGALEDSLQLERSPATQLKQWLDQQLANTTPGQMNIGELLQLLIEYLQNGGSRDQGSMNRGGNSGFSGSPRRVSWGNNNSGGGGSSGSTGSSGSNGSTRAPGTNTMNTPATTATPNLPPGQNLEGLKIQVLGDSLSVGAQSKMESALSGAGAAGVGVDAQSGRSISANGGGNSLSPAQIRERAEASGANVVVVELGSNHADYARFIPETMNELSKIQPPPLVVWVNTQTQRPANSQYGQQYYDQNASINEIIAREAANRPNVVIADWSAIAGGPGINGGDGLHLTQQGNDAMANLILQTIADARDRAG
jgi:hypothetical protein